MPILLFLIDTSASMNQRTDLGTSYLDIAKGAVELFLKVKGREGRDGKISRGGGGGGGVDLGASVTFVLPFPPSFPSRAPSVIPLPAAARPGPSQPRRQVHAGHLRRTPVLHQGKGAIKRVRRPGMGASGLGQLPFLAPTRAVLRRRRDVGRGGRRRGLAERCCRRFQSHFGARGQGRGSPGEKPQESLTGGGGDRSGHGRWRTFCFCMSQRGRLWALLRWKGGRGGRGRDPPLRGAPRATVTKGKGEPATPPQVLWPARASLKPGLHLWPLLPPHSRSPQLPLFHPPPLLLLSPPSLPLSSCSLHPLPAESVAASATGLQRLEYCFCTSVVFNPPRAMENLSSEQASQPPDQRNSFRFFFLIVWLP